MADWFDADHLDVERLLAGWRWLCPNPMSLVARNNHGGRLGFVSGLLRVWRFIPRRSGGQIHRLGVAIGKLEKVADSEGQFTELAPRKQEEWFAETDEAAAAAKGLKPDRTQCTGFSVPPISTVSLADVLAADLQSARPCSWVGRQAHEHKPARSDS